MYKYVLAALLIAGGAAFWRMRPTPLRWHALAHDELSVKVRRSEEARVEFTHAQGEVRITRRKMSREEAVEAVGHRVDAIRMMFQDYKSPYPGVVSTVVQCMPEEMPILIEPHENRLGGIAFTTTERFVPRGCGADGAGYPARLLGYHCSGELYIVEVYSKHEVAEGFRCVGE